MKEKEDIRFYSTYPLKSRLALITMTDMTTITILINFGHTKKELNDPLICYGNQKTVKLPIIDFILVPKVDV